MARPKVLNLLPLLTIAATAALICLLAYWGSNRIFIRQEKIWTPDQIKEWFTYEFAEVKGISQQFITVVTGVLVFSVTFSEKIIHYEAAHSSQRLFLKASWCCCVLAIVGGGVSIVLIMLAGAFVRYPGSGDYEVAERFSFLALGLAGLVFVVGLICLLTSAFWGAARKPPPKVEI